MAHFDFTHFAVFIFLIFTFYIFCRCFIIYCVAVSLHIVLLFHFLCIKKQQNNILWNRNHYIMKEEQKYNETGVLVWLFHCVLCFSFIIYCVAVGYAVQLSLTFALLFRYILYYCFVVLCCCILIYFLFHFILCFASIMYGGAVLFILFCSFIRLFCFFMYFIANKTRITRYIMKRVLNTYLNSYKIYNEPATQYIIKWQQTI